MTIIEKNPKCCGTGVARKIFVETEEFDKNLDGLPDEDVSAQDVFDYIDELNVPDSSDVLANTAHRQGDGSDHTDVAQNTSNLTAHEAETETHGTTGDIVGEENVQTLTNKTLDDYTNTIHADAIHFRVKATEDIAKGQAVSITGWNVGESAYNVALADNTVGPANGLVSEAMASGAFGMMESVGTLTDIDTSTWSEQTILYVNGGGNLTSTEPSTGYAQPIAFVVRSHASNGALQINADYPKQDAGDVRTDTTNFNNNLSASDNTAQKALDALDNILIPSEKLDGYLDGMSIERQELSVVVDTTHVYLDVQAIGGGDIDYYIDGTEHTLDCTTGSGAGGTARIELTQGTAIQPVASLVYVSYSEQESKLVLSVTAPSSIPNESYAPVAIMTIQDYISVAANGALVTQRTTEAVEHNGKGAISWEREKIRALGAQYWNGIDQSVDITTNAGSEDDIDFSVTSGTVFQLHRQQLSSTSVSTDGIMVANASGSGTLTNFQELSDINEIHEISDGTFIADGDSINLVVWGSVNYGGENKLFINLPNAKYTDDDNAKLDTDKTAITAIPSGFKTTGYLIAKLVLKYNSADNGTWENLLTETVETWHTASQTWTTPNYPTNYDNNYHGLLATLTETGAEAMRVVFDSFNTEANYDFLRLQNAADVTIYSYHGNLGGFTSAAVTGDTIKVWFDSDGSVTRKGVRSLSYEYMTSSSSGQAVIDLRGIPAGFNLGASGGSASAVQSVFGRNGVVTAVAGDYDASEITVSTTNFTKNLSATDDTIQKAVDTIDDLELENAITIQDKVVNITGITDEQYLAYNSTSDEFEPASPGTPAAHASTHESGGSDEIDSPSSALILAVGDAMNPVGTIKEFNVSTNPGTLLGFGTWSLHGVGRTTVCIDTGDTDFDTVDETRGAKTHTLTEEELAKHKHGIYGPKVLAAGTAYEWMGAGIGIESEEVGGDVAHNNIQPSIVTYRWIRTA